ncbi:CDP-alcohol phosphatidyltransferase family protein [Geoglobus acetivorans]|uniref:CDP-diacylglycerol--serine O-phosphatidyltransferase n=1 Tax=Geoglobus acetivorans TaxID=565033 RepID=A0A0A7GGD0_GEOAI|nr:CDP-diacylglycerol--serine O-phosphatidyltransferase [Geoglobus acetivorans]
MKRHLDFADYFSFSNVVAGFLAIILNDMRFIFIAALMDGFDGYFARKGYSGKYGKFVDSLADFVSFGLATAFFIPYFSLPYLLAGMYRLARFTAEDTEDFTGFPITSSSLAVITSAIIFGEFTAGFFSIILSFFMISNIIYKKVRNTALLSMTAIILVLSVFYTPAVYVLFVLNLLYLISPPFYDKMGKYF